MEYITVGFSRPKGFFEPFSWLIRLAYWSPFSHAYIRMDLKEINREVIFQASGLEVNFIGKTLFDTREHIYKEFRFSISEQKKKELLDFAISQLGRPYSVRGIFGMILVRIGNLLNIKINNPFYYDKSSDFCSELVAYILEKYEGVKIDTAVANLAPSDLFEIISNLSD